MDVECFPGSDSSVKREDEPAGSGREDASEQQAVESESNHSQRSAAKEQPK